MPTQIPVTSAQYMRVLGILHLALTLGAAGAIASMGVVALTQEPEGPDLKIIFMVVVGIVGLGAFTASMVAYNALLAKAKSQNTLGDKLQSYQTAFIVRAALAEAPVMLSGIATLMTGELMFLLVGGIFLVHLAMLRPSRDRVEMALELNREESAAFQNPDQEIMRRTPSED